MLTEIRYTTIQRVLDNLLDHPMLSDLALEQVIRYALRFISKHGYNKLYQDKLIDIEIKDFRGVLPCDVISITQIKDLSSGVCLRSMTNNFPMGMTSTGEVEKYITESDGPTHSTYIAPKKVHTEELSFKTQGRIIYTSFPEGAIQVAYKAIPTDEDGFPLLLDNETYLDALEAYIKKQVFTVKFDQQKISASVLQNAQIDYAVAARLLQSEMTLPSPSEMRTLSAIWNTMIPKAREFDNGFKNLGDREYLRKN